MVPGRRLPRDGTTMVRWARMGLPWIALFGVVAVVVGRVWQDPPFTPDSWVYWELGRSVFDDFFRVNTLRYYASGAPPHSSAVGPVFPVAIGVVARIAGTGYRSALLVNVAAVLVTAAAVEIFMRRERSISGIGPALALVLLCFPLYLDDLVSGRSAPVTVALLALLVLAARPGTWPLSGVRAATVGVVVAALGLTRFDQLLLIVLVPVLLLGVGAWRARRLVPYTLGIAVAASGWVAYSLSTFGRVFATADQGDPLRGIDGRAWVQGPAPPVDLIARAGTAVRSAVGVLPLWASVLAQVLVPAVALAVAVVLVRRPWREPVLARGWWQDPQHRLIGGLAAVSAVAELASIAVAGQHEPRYAIPFAFFVAWLIGTTLVRPNVATPGVSGATDTGSARSVAVVVVVVVVSLPLLVARTPLQLMSGNRWGRVRWQPESAEIDRSLEAILRCASSPGPILFVPAGSSWDAGYRFGGLTGRATAVEPVNIDSLTADDRDRFLSRFAIAYLYADPSQPGSDGAALAQRWTGGDMGRLTGGCAPGLYAISGPP